MQQKAGDCGDRARFRFPYGSWQPRNSHVRLAGEEATGRGTARSDAGGRSSYFHAVDRGSRVGWGAHPHDQFVIVDLCLGADGRRGEGKTLPARAMITLGPLQIPVFPSLLSLRLRLPLPAALPLSLLSLFAQPIPPRGGPGQRQRSLVLAMMFRARLDGVRSAAVGEPGMQVGRSVDEVLSHHASD